MATKSRRALLAATVIAATIVPAASANAAVTSTGDLPDVVSELATDAARLLDEERALVDATASLGATPGLDQVHRDLQTDLETVDVQGNTILDRFDQLGVQVSPSVRATLTMLPTPPAADAETAGRSLPAPPPVVYEAAIVDLGRIADTPESAVPAEPGDGEPSLGLLLVAGGALLAFGFATRTSAARRDEEMLAAMAWRDGLTGVANRRRLERDLTSGDPELGPTSVVMIDVDHFESVTVTYGRQTGDDVLRQVGAMLAEQVREHDVVYRYGDEEFCVLLLGASTEDARTIGERVVHAARAIALPDGTHVTVSVGIAAGDPGAVAETLGSADRALVEAKIQGRDRVLTVEQLQPA